MTVSACLIVRNEEARLAKCLQSLAGAVDEIIIADTGSTDATREVARRFGVEPFSHPWADDFAAARNAALDRATGDWVLSIDADEWLAHDQARTFIRTAPQTTPPEVAYVARIWHGTRAIYTNGRLFPRLGTRWHYRVHEQLRFEGREPTHLRHEHFELGHTGYDTPGAKRPRNMRLLERMREEAAPNSPEWRFATIHIARNLPRPYSEPDLVTVENALLFAAGSEPAMADLLTFRLYRQLIETGRFDEIERINRQAYAQGARGPLHHLARAIELLESGNLDGARTEFTHATTVADDYYVREELAPLFQQFMQILAHPPQM